MARVFLASFLLSGGTVLPPHLNVPLRTAPPETLLDAQALHSAAMNRARAVERLHGHARPSRLLAGTVDQCAGAGIPLRPVDFGADPTGAKDSTEAMQAAMQALLTVHGPRKTMASNITDLGGATLDLSGGSYLISEPLVIPPYFGNAQIVRGTLRASSTFPVSRWLVEIGANDCSPKLPDGRHDVQGSCGQMINLNEMMFDASHVAAGGVRVQKTMGTTIGPSVFFVGFKQVGVRIDGGHEVMIQQAWFAECMWSDARGSVCQEDPMQPGGNESKSIGVQINGNDHFLTDVIIFEFTHIGVEINGAANLLQGVHAWNAAILSKSNGYFQRGGVGIAINAHQNRLLGCYLDYSSLVVTDPSQTIVESTFFLATSAIFKSKRKTSINAVNFHGNTYAGNGPSIVLDPAIADGTNCVIADEFNAGPSTLKTTMASKTVSHETEPSSSFIADFDTELLLPSIEEVQYSLVVIDGDEPFVQHRSVVNGTRVEVQTNKPVRARVAIRVAQAVNGMPAPPSKWTDLGAGCCDNLEEYRTEAIFDSYGGNLENCKQRCARTPTCGYVMYGWQDSTWCVAWPQTVGCSALDGGGDGHCGSRGDDGVHSYKRQNSTRMI